MDAPDRIDAHLLSHEIGRGGVGVVYAARHDTLHTHHAVKLIPCASPALRARVRREGRLQAGLSHDHIVRVTDYLELPGQLCLVSDLVPGPDLHRWTRSRSPCWWELMPLLRDVARALAHAHSGGVVHRDVKPANVLIDESSGQPRALLTDFGIARALRGPDAAALTEDSSVMGTLSYMAPEALSGDLPVGPPADVFSFACMAWELLLGENPYPADTAKARLCSMRRGSPARAPLLRLLPRALAALVLDCLHLDPQRRPPDGAALLAGFDQAGRGRANTAVQVEETGTFPWVSA